MGGVIGHAVYESFIKGTPFEDITAVIGLSMLGIIAAIIIWSYIDLLRKKKKKRMFVLGPITFRIGFVLLSFVIGRFSFINIHNIYITNLPQWTQAYEKSLRPEYVALRKSYNDAFSTSLIFAIVIFVICFALFDYIYRMRTKHIVINKDNEMSP